MEEYAKLEAARELEDAALAKKHGIKPELISKIKFGKPLKGTRAVNIENAKVSDLAKRINTGLETNQRHAVPALKKMVKEDPRYQNLSKVQEKELVKRLEDKRDKKKTGVRPSALSSSQDVSANIKSFHDQLITMSERTEIAAICFFARSSMSQSYAPRWLATPNAMDFAPDAFGQTMWDVTRGLEAWCVTNKNKKPGVSFLILRSECAKVISGSLESITGTKGVRMVYINYEDQIVSKLGVMLVGWTYKDFVNPSEITGIDDLKTLHNALTTGACHWVRLSKAQLTAHNKDLAKRRAAGEVIGTKRKPRIDKGVTKGPREPKSTNNDDNDADDDEMGRPSKRQKTTPATLPHRALNNVTNTKQSTKTAQLPPQPRRIVSNEFVDTDTESEESVEDEA
ncbi:hypothetical protein BJ165DRAFT_1369009 [Panaeolus papilionaceus]|nr:hypothetical protein BJ165DRAFT_1369009 [Panaeolus papilionaceus]